MGGVERRAKVVQAIVDHVVAQTTPADCDLQLFTSLWRPIEAVRVSRENLVKSGNPRECGWRATGPLVVSRCGHA